MFWIEYLGVSVILIRHKQFGFGPLVFLLEKLSLIKKMVNSFSA